MEMIILGSILIIDICILIIVISKQNANCVEGEK